MTDVTESPQAPASGGGTERAAGIATATKDQASVVASTTADEAKNVASEAVTEVKDLVADAREQLRTQAGEQSAKVATAIGDIGTQLRKMAAAGDAGTTQHLMTGLADRAQQMSQRLGDGGLERTLSDARRVARNRPGLFLAGAALAGFVAARVVRLADTDSLKEATTGANGSSPDAQQASPRPASLPPLVPTTTTAPTMSAVDTGPTRGL